VRALVDYHKREIEEKGEEEEREGEKTREREREREKREKEKKRIREVGGREVFQVAHFPYHDKTTA